MILKKTITLNTNNKQQSRYHFNMLYRNGCIFSEEAVRLLRQLAESNKAITVDAEDVYGHQALFITKMQTILNTTQSVFTVPQIWVNGEYLGGCKELISWLSNNT